MRPYFGLINDWVPENRHGTCHPIVARVRFAACESPSHHLFRHLPKPGDLGTTFSTPASPRLDTKSQLCLAGIVDAVNVL